jgi:hypothetical protein|tara:strand:+ start:220 stop:1134 length:915 start_codon:yes stop_codon:yes gene_type:complete
MKYGFDGLVTNPPYADASHTERKNTLWRKWFGFDSLVVDDGVFALIPPSSWMGSPPIIKKYFTDENGLKVNITHLNRDECARHFTGIGSNFSYFVYLKNKYLGKTDVVAKNVNKKIEISTLNLNDLIFDVLPRDLSKCAESILSKTLVNREPLGVLNSTKCHANNKHLWSDTKGGEFKYPIEKYPDVIIYYNREHPHQDIPKIVIPTTTYFRVMYYTINGTSQSLCYYNLKDNEDKDIVLNNINNKLFDYLNECFRYSNWNSVNLLRKLPKLPMENKMSDKDVYDYFGLTGDDVNRIEEMITWR